MGKIHFVYVYRESEPFYIDTFTKFESIYSPMLIYKFLWACYNVSYVNETFRLIYNRTREHFETVKNDNIYTNTSKKTCLWKSVCDENFFQILDYRVFQIRGKGGGKFPTTGENRKFWTFLLGGRTWGVILTNRTFFKVKNNFL